MIKKNEEYIVECIDVTNKGLGVCKPKDFVVFVPNLLKNEHAKIKIVKVLSKFGYGKVIERFNDNSFRDFVACKFYPMCGGCQIMHLSQEGQRQFLFDQVQLLLKDYPIDPVVSMDNPWGYRNKVLIPIHTDDQVAGYFRLHSNKIVDIDECLIQSDRVNSCFRFLKQWVFDQKLRHVSHLIFREGFNTHDLMVGLVLNSKSKINESKLVEDLLCFDSSITTIVLNYQLNSTNTILGKETKVLYGSGFIHEKIHDFVFQLSLNSFFQVNTKQCEVLYEVVKDVAQLSKEDHLLDLYCGVGTIGICMSPYVKKVVGVEIVDAAIKDAWENAGRNHIDNIDFVCQDASVFVSENERLFDVVIVDPPRKGLTPQGIQDILRVSAKKIVYVSCNPVTLARDLKLFDGYRVDMVVPVDLFGQSSHVETVVLMSRVEK